MRRSKFFRHLVVPALAAVAITAAHMPAQAGGGARIMSMPTVSAISSSTAPQVTANRRRPGRQVRDVAKYLKAGQPDVDIVYADGDGENQVVYERGCYRPPALIKGRSYMYGFDQGEIPFQGGDCR